MELVIEIDKKAFDYIMACSFVEDEAVMLNQSLEDRIKTLMFFDVLNAIKSGTPLPKGHGRLIDADYLRDDFKTSKKISFAERMDISCIVDHAPTIIESDKGTDKSEV